MTKSTQKTEEKQAHSHKMKSELTIVSVRNSLTSRQKIVIFGSLGVILVASAILAGLVTESFDKNRRANAGGESSLGVPTPSDDETDNQVTPTTALPSNKFFSIDGLVLGTNEAFVTWDLNQGDATSTAPFPRNGIYRITYTEDTSKSDSWRPVNTGKLGTGIEMRFDAANGDQLAQWTPVGYDNGGRTENILPATAKLGQKFFFRLEIKEMSGVWTAIKDTSLEVVVPYPEVQLTSQPKYSEDTPWNADPASTTFGTTNPIISIFWYGNSDDNTAPYSYLYVSDSPAMTNKAKAVINNLITHETFDATSTNANSSYFTLAQEPAKTKYYAVYNQAGQQLSQITTITSKAKE